jgi:hypothetical protein
MVAYGYIFRFKLETSSKDAKAHFGVLSKENENIRKPTYSWLSLLE